LGNRTPRPLAGLKYAVSKQREIELKGEGSGGEERKETKGMEMIRKEREARKQTPSPTHGNLEMNYWLWL